MDMEKKVMKYKTYVRKFILDNYNLSTMWPVQEVGVRLDMSVSYELNGISARGILMQENGKEMVFDYLYTWDEMLPEEVTGTFTLTEVLDMLRSLQLFHKLITGDVEIEELVHINAEAVSKMTDEFQSEFSIPTMAFACRGVEADSYTRDGLNYNR